MSAIVNNDFIHKIEYHITVGFDPTFGHVETMSWTCMQPQLQSNQRLLFTLLSGGIIKTLCEQSQQLILTRKQKIESGPWWSSLLTHSCSHDYTFNMAQLIKKQTVITWQQEYASI